MRASDLVRLLRVAGEVASDRALERRRFRRDRIPPEVADVDADWLTEALGPCSNGARVDRVRTLGGHAGTTTRARLALEGSAGPTGTLPETVFLKIAPRPFAIRIFTTLFGLGATEVDFYAAFPDAFPIRVPRAFAARRAPRGGRFVLLLEDLEAGDCRFTTTEERPTEAEVVEVVATLGRLHGAFWESPRFGSDLRFLCAREGSAQRGLEWRLAARSTTPALAEFGDVVPEAVRAAAPRVHVHRARLEARWASEPRTLIHGDPHAGNLFFDGGRVGFFDWQVAQRGPGLRDLAYFLINSVDTELRRSRERDWIRHYLATLREHGGAAIPFDAAWESYRLFALYAWIAISFTAAAPGLQPRSVVAAAVERTATALADLDSFAALDALLGDRPRAFGPGTG